MSGEQQLPSLIRVKDVMMIKVILIIDEDSFVMCVCERGFLSPDEYSMTRKEEEEEIFILTQSSSRSVHLCLVSSIDQQI